MKLLAISGWKQNGKDTLADYLIANYNATRVSFADPLKDMAAKEYGISRESLDLPSQKEQPILSMPVQPQDAFSKMLCEFMIKEFRSADGQQPRTSGYSGEEFLGFFPNDKAETVYWTPRALAILKGSSNRAVRSDFWVSQAIDLAKSKGGLIVISDMRYKSEMAQMRAAFGSDMVTMRVQRYETSPSTDPSERDLDDAEFDYRISNKGTKEEMFAQLNEIMATLK